MSSKLKLYRRATRCPKCHWGQINEFPKTRYQKATDTILRTCRNCSYCWHQRPLTLGADVQGDHMRLRGGMFSTTFEPDFQSKEEPE